MIIKTLLDTDLYKFTTSYAYIKLFPYAIGTFSFNDRNETHYTEEFLQTLKTEIEKLRRLRLTEEELEYMANNCRFLPRVYWEWLSSFRFDPRKINIYLDANHQLHMEVTDLLYKVTLYEVPLLAIVSEIKNRFFGYVPDKNQILDKLSEKIRLSNREKLLFSEFGTRRRFSFDVQDAVIKELKETSRYCTGTSNCYFAMKYNTKMMGTHPHEWFMFHGAQFGYKHANYMALENWVNVYDGDLGIALSDTYTSDIFLTNISRKQAKLFDGVRCDSGNEFEFIDKLTFRYKELGIDSTTKTVVFSNGLDFKKALKIQAYCKGRIRCSFGIGTNLTNDTGFDPSNIVMKLSQCKMNINQEWRQCIKLSDDEGKHTGTPEEVQACLRELRLPIT
ncbi:nicotinate phosphoribosyltransferase [Bacteroides reticulotermitis]|uniref:Nicotinate phosphoribosyltransferase n=2 Tax=Bacteroides reticulotermitis TaxID=1133319 RepID=W4UX45_9BACE|nr:nicotinate phosphoribosyltransferase [Bacteroides reticulotermitis]MBB4042309.1 nicotinate phosphoribosyltransferase [Bacteroides reticulotermitis]GAE85178.1 nicotinate phosphoribosyltransferase [Bacteroides reticulotermitis JCM 10512]